MRINNPTYRLGAVSFLNTIPLIEWFDTPANTRVLVQRDLPSRLSGLLENDEVDVALLPVVEVFRGRSGGLLPGTGIAGYGPVDSVKLLAAGGLESLTRVWTDRGSRSSVALLQTLFLEKTGNCPEFLETEPRAGHWPAKGEGLLVIGDRCFECDRSLRNDPQSDLHEYDLGQLWTELTGLPFVFAAWSVSPRFVDKFGSEGVVEIKALLQRARDHGLGILDSLAMREAKNGQLGYKGEATAEAIDYYFRKSLRYTLGDSEMAGLLRFQELCLEHGIIEAPSSLKIL